MVASKVRFSWYIRALVTWSLISCWRCLRRSRSSCKDCSRSFCWHACSEALTHALPAPPPAAPAVGAGLRCNSCAETIMFTCYVVLLTKVFYLRLLFLEHAAPALTVILERVLTYSRIEPRGRACGVVNEVYFSFRRGRLLPAVRQRP